MLSCEKDPVMSGCHNTNLPSDETLLLQYLDRCLVKLESLAHEVANLKATSIYQMRMIKELQKNEG